MKRKIKKAYCPPQVVEGNPILDYTKHIIFGYYGTLKIEIAGVSCPPPSLSHASWAGGCLCSVSVGCLCLALTRYHSSLPVGWVS